MHVMTKAQAAERGLFTKDPITGKQVPFTTWRVELTEQQKREQEKQVANGTLPF